MPAGGGVPGRASGAVAEPGRAKGGVGAPGRASKGVGEPGRASGGVGEPGRAPAGGGVAGRVAGGASGRAPGGGAVRAGGGVPGRVPVGGGEPGRAPGGAERGSAAGLNGDASDAGRGSAPARVLAGSAEGEFQGVPRAGCPGKGPAGSMLDGCRPGPLAGRAPGTFQVGGWSAGETWDPGVRTDGPGREPGPAHVSAGSPGPAQVSAGSAWPAHVSPGSAPPRAGSLMPDQAADDSREGPAQVVSGDGAAGPVHVVSGGGAEGPAQVVSGGGAEGPAQVVSGGGAAGPAQVVSGGGAARFQAGASAGFRPGSAPRCCQADAGASQDGRLGGGGCLRSGPASVEAGSAPESVHPAGRASSPDRASRGVAAAPPDT
ncbi:hypothetical protein [Actinoplanes sp. NBRC 103695]|uniref:hypothetical protein n=1 Tax=Actinoplanes sp. NBRC 103695 TaxID=3032202 RepID=UPI0024A0BA55|nr:hypothetical protein Acsp02_05780 [Actinoplanes sp. NBRC 103695]